MFKKILIIILLVSSYSLSRMKLLLKRRIGIPKRLFVAILLLGLVTKCNAEEQITITTYYPSPYGVYREMRAQRMAVGETYINHSLVCWEGDTNCDGSGGQTMIPSANDVDLIVQGKVGIGTTSPTDGFKLDVIGALRCQSLTQYSSRDYKQDIETLAPSDYRDILKKLEQTEIFRFRYKEAKENSRLRLGLIAEEAPEEIVSHEGKGIDLGEAVSFLMAAVKAQAEEIKGLKQEIGRLKRN